MSVLRFPRFGIVSMLGSIALALTGCAFNAVSVAPSAGAGGITPGTGTARTTLGGKVYGGQQPIAGAAVTLWAAGTIASYGSGATTVAATTTDANGNFSFNNAGMSPCTTGQYLYITSLGGDPGGGSNPYAAAMAALPTPCGPGTAGSFVVVNEITTVASVTALQQFMSITPGGAPAWNIGAPSANVTGLANAFVQVGNLVSIATGTSAATTAASTINSVIYTTTITPDSTKINTLANILAACVNTAGSSICNSLFADATPAGAAAPTDTIQAMYYLAANAGGMGLPAHAATQGEPYYLCSTYISGTPPFQPSGECSVASTTYPTDWAIGVTWSTSNGTAIVGTANSYSLAVDGLGNIWTAYSVSSGSTTAAASISEFNQAGQELITPVTGTTITAGPTTLDSGGTITSYSPNFTATMTGNPAVSVLGGRVAGLAIDTNNNAWFAPYYSTAPATTGAVQGLLTKVTQTGISNGILIPAFAPGAIAIDGNNNIYIDDTPTNNGRSYTSELEFSNSSHPGVYAVYDVGIDRQTAMSNVVWADPLGYAWAVSTKCSGSPITLYRANTAGFEATSTSGNVTNVAATCPGVSGFPDATGGAYYASGNLFNVAISSGSASLSAPVVTTVAAGTGTSNGGLDGGGGTFVDGLGNVWVANSAGGVSEFSVATGVFVPLSPSGTAAVPVYGFGTSLLAGTNPLVVAADSSGNVWIGTNGTSLHYLVGIAGPAVTPTSAMLKTSFVGERPGAQTLVTLSPALNFSSLVSVAQPQTATLTNTGSAPVKISAVSIGGTNQSDFTVTNNTCGPVLGVGANCSITVSFTSSTAGTFSGILNVASNAAGSPASVVLTGVASTSVTLNLAAGTSTSPTVPAVTFPNLVAGSVSLNQVVVVTNTGSVPLTLALSLSGAGANLFPQTTTCGGSLAAGASCNIGVKFAPKVAGTYSAAVTLIDNAGSGSQAIPLSGVATPFAITINTTNASDWKIDNGAVSIDWSSTGGNIFGLVMDGYSDPLTDITGTQGFYMDNAGLGGGGATSTYAMGPGGSYLDWSITTPSSATNAYTYSEHFVVYPNDPGWHVYFVANHATTDIAGGIGQIQWVFRDNLTQFTNTYEVNPSVNSPGVTTLTLPANNEMFSPDPGRAVQDATNDLHGFTDLPAGWTRGFYTKYDHAGYEYMHQAHGLFGSKYGVWTVFPKSETLVGGTTKQDLYFTGNLNMIEAFSNHEINGMSLTTPAGTASSRLFGPFYVHLNMFGTAYNQTGNALQTPADMYADALQASAALVPSYDSETQLTGNGYVASTGRGSVSIQVNGVLGATRTAWAVLSDPNKNFEYSSQGMQYWADISATGSATISGVVPGTYRLSVYVLGQWGELRQDGIVVSANSTTAVPTVTFVPENFGTTLFTIGTPDRSSHEFLHGHFANGNDDREFWGAWNYWADFAANSGAVIYNATDGPAGSATNDLTKWNYNHPGNRFDPGLFGGVYNASDDTTDGYTYAIPAYVGGLPGASGTNGVLTPVPAWQIHFATPANFNTQSYVVLSVSVACAEGSYTVNLNGQPLVWHVTNASDCMVRSGLSGYTQWFAMQWPTSALTQTAGADNLITISISQTSGSEDDALRLELTNISAAPSTTGWNDYTYIPGSTATFNNDAIPNP